jgi:hypothetical protein
MAARTAKALNAGGKVGFDRIVALQHRATMLYWNFEHMQ